MGLLLYLVAVLLEALPLLLRYWLVSYFLGPVAGLVAAFGPLLWSMATLIGVPGGGWWTRGQLGARPPSQRERETIEAGFDAVLPLTEKHPRSVLVVDAPTTGAMVIGTTLYVERGLLQTGDLVPILVHELGHMRSLDGQLSLAVQRLQLPGTHWTQEWATGAHGSARHTDVSLQGCLIVYGGLISTLVAGGFGALVLSPAWGIYWRQREFAADVCHTGHARHMPGTTRKHARSPPMMTPL